MPFSWNPVPGANICVELTCSLRSLGTAWGNFSALIIISDAKSVHFVKRDRVVFFKLFDFFVLLSSGSNSLAGTSIYEVST